VKVVFAANGEIAFRVGGVERDPEFVEPGVDQRAAVALVQHRSVGVEQDIDAPVLQVPHHSGQVFHQHGLADAVQHRAGKARNLVYDRRE
jgi:hypothetical protein